MERKENTVRNGENKGNVEGNVKNYSKLEEKGRKSIEKKIRTGKTEGK
jgi:hypothetical protein